MKLLLGIVGLVIGVFFLAFVIYIFYLSGELKPLIFDKSLTSDEKRKIRNQSWPLIVIPIGLIVAFYFGKETVYLTLKIYAVLVVGPFVFSSSKKNREIEKKKDNTETMKEVAGEIGNEIGSELHDLFH